VNHGYDSTKAIMAHLRPVLDDPARRVIVAGDLNLLPRSIPRRVFKDHGLVELSTYTASQRQPLDGCTHCDAGDACGHLWTHRNGNGLNARRQQIDFLMASKPHLRRLVSYEGGPDRFPDIWTMSDHAPLVATFRI